MAEVNSYGQRIGELLVGWQARQLPAKVTLSGKYCTLEPLNIEEHSSELFDAYGKAGDDRMWTYLPIGPFENKNSFKEHCKVFLSNGDAHYTIINNTTRKPVGQVSLIRCDPQNGSIEVGFVTFSPELQRTIMATEAHYLLAKYVFEILEYRRYEWKCHSLNEPSGNAAKRLGFQYEGFFRQAAILKGRSRDTFWFSIIDKEWPVCKAAFEAWLADENFINGKQRVSLADIRKRLLD